MQSSDGGLLLLGLESSGRSTTARWKSVATNSNLWRSSTATICTRRSRIAAADSLASGAAPHGQSQARSDWLNVDALGVADRITARAKASVEATPDGR